MQTTLLFADAMLGGLARWLRLLDIDTALAAPTLSDRELVRLANAQSRVVLTRDRHLIRFLRPDRGLLVAAQRTDAQLREVVDAIQLPRPEALFLRCLVCNGRLEAASAEQILERVPASARTFDQPIRHCPDCDRVYWFGSHTRRMTEHLQEVLPQWFA